MKSPTVPHRMCLLPLLASSIGALFSPDGFVFSSLISFTPRQRHIGEAAKTAETSNFKNTVGSLKRLVGRTLGDAEVTEFEKKFMNAELVDVNGNIGVRVSLPKGSRKGTWRRSFLGDT